MTDKEVMERAKEYIDRLSAGTNPITGEPVEENDVVRNVRISKCLTYVSHVLAALIANGGNVTKKTAAPFKISGEQLKKFRFSDEPVSVSEIVRRINETVNENESGKLSYTVIVQWLESEGYLEMKETDGQRGRRPCVKGKAIGIIEEDRKNIKGNYIAVLYTKGAQKFVIDNLQEMIKAAYIKSSF